MDRTRHLALVFVFILSLVAPAMTYALPNAGMTAQERACCRMMKNQCGQMEMPASHGCCQKAPPSVYDNALDTRAVALHSIALPAIWLTAYELLNPASVVTGSIEHPDYTPPKPPLSAISILRI